MPNKKVKRKLKKWKILEEKTVYQCDPWIRLDVHKVKLPDGQIIDDFHYLAMPEYVVVYPVTSNDKVLMLESYRHGVGGITCLFPGGLIDKGETPLSAAKRELLEETGYGCGVWQSTGTYVQHSNYGGGKAHMFKVTGVEKVQPPNSGDLEEANIHLFNHSSLVQLLIEGRIASLSSISALLLGINNNIIYKSNKL